MKKIIADSKKRLKTIREAFEMRKKFKDDVVNEDLSILYAEKNATKTFQTVGEFLIDAFS